jgi:hypothetical protein
MSTSLPSREIYSFDVPEVSVVTTEFKYNFFVPDEKTNASGGIPPQYAKLETTELGAIAENSQLLNKASLKLPRLVKISWKIPSIRFPGTFDRVDDTKQKTLPQQQSKNYIAKNISKLVYEDRLAANSYVSVNFQDADIDNRMYKLVSGSYEALTVGTNVLSSDNPTQKALRAAEVAPPNVNPDFMTTAMAQPLFSTNIKYNSKNTASNEPLFDKLKKVNLNIQVNMRSLASLVDKTSKSSFAPTSQAFIQLSSQKKIYDQLSKIGLGISDNDYKTFLPFVGIRQTTSNTKHEQQAKLLGFIIHKYEILANGSSKQHPDIIVENPQSNAILDLKIIYDGVYYYTVRCVYLVTLSAIDNKSRAAASLDVLVASRPSQKSFVTCTEQVAPPPPTDVRFTWNYDRPNGAGKRGSLLIHWNFPVNPQRDIKKFHLLRRSSLIEPFEVIRVFDFDDSIVKTPNQETYEPSTVLFNLNPVLSFYDDTFSKSSKYIYAISSQDAHGFISAYSTQFEVSFNTFENAIQTKLVSSLGAPRPYPNMYVEQDMFVDAIRVSGERSKQMTVIFDPEYYNIYSGNKTLHKISTLQNGGRYKINIINVDTQKQNTVEVLIDDPSKLVE